VEAHYALSYPPHRKVRGNVMLIAGRHTATNECRDCEGIL
jgi:hypothetical protein